ncbi:MULTISPECIES: prolyl aminopeptidase [unclassified Guyparkeria]|uniref:prolyl aminopeptidase n=1 Tax=unclassified Guyparkeria TaxID=2626246 RepID=UPI000733439A|nr:MULTISPECIES: prolyl aminopeptidase [unclassified Guyparkeria]KTG16933.1 proline iminopeptidase [Guyparkeria sp. XI15]OAE85967.1 proline iminopeptidase [Guyparkeria sp. WRN-7]
MRTLYPPVESLVNHSFPVGDGHVLHVEECGRLDGIPALFLHGGPGAGCTPMHRRFFDPDRYRVVLPDQRGAGGSTPHASLEANTTAHLVDDLERIREALEIERWLVFGGSWGSTLALAYAQAHPERVTGLILRGVFLCREQDIRWFYQDGASHVFPDYWADYLEPIPEAERDDLVAAYRRRLDGEDEIARLQAARAWSVWEGRCATLRPEPEVVDYFANAHHALSIARIENHYFSHDAFLERPLLDGVDRLAGIPGHIVHGRYDMVCPIDQAFALKDRWPHAELEVIDDAGHAASEPGIVDALVRATDRFADQLQGRGGGGA